MTLLYITVNLPHGCSEAFFLPEIRTLLALGHNVILVPRSPAGPLVHGSDLLPRSARESLFSPRVLFRAACVLCRRPLAVLSSLAPLMRSRSLPVALKNLAVVPKALWLSHLAGALPASHIHSQWAATTATMAMIASRLSGVPWSFTAHRGDIVENNLLAFKVETASFARFISEDGLNLARSKGVSSGAPAFVLHMGVDTPPRANWRPPSPHVLICPARLAPVKGHIHLLRALRLLLDRGLDVRLLLAGEGESLNALRSLTRRLSLLPAVTFLGAVPHDSLLALYRRSTVSAVVLPSLDLGHGFHEGIPVALMEAMSYAVPVVATRTGAIAELVLPGSGVLVPPADAPALAAAIESLLVNPDAAARVGRAGRRRILEAFDQSRIVRRFSESLLAASPQPGCATTVLR